MYVTYGYVRHHCLMYPTFFQFMHAYIMIITIAQYRNNVAPGRDSQDKGKKSGLSRPSYRNHGRLPTRGYQLVIEAGQLIKHIGLLIADTTSFLSNVNTCILKRDRGGGGHDLEISNQVDHDILININQ